MGINCNEIKNKDPNQIGRLITNQLIDQYICPNCKKVPVLKAFYSGTGQIEFKCKGHIETDKPLLLKIIK